MSEEVKNIIEGVSVDDTSSTNEDVEAVAEEFRSIVVEEAIEAILFAAGHPISYATLARVFNVTPNEIKRTVSDYSIKYNNSDIPRGVLLLTYTDSCQLCTKQHYLAEIREALGL